MSSRAGRERDCNKTGIIAHISAKGGGEAFATAPRGKRKHPALEDGKSNPMGKGRGCTASLAILACVCDRPSELAWAKRAKMRPRYVGQEEEEVCVCQRKGSQQRGGGGMRTRNWIAAVVVNRVVNDPGSLGFGSR